MPRLNLADRLARVAAPLQPAQAPYHVQTWTRGHEAFGWYWKPADADAPVYLGANHVHAEVRLLELRDSTHAAA